MGKPDLFAKRTFAAHTERITGGAASWKDAPQIGLEHVQGDGILAIHDPERLKTLASPWNLVAEIDEILLEFKLQGDHVDLPAISRTLLRRQAREVQRHEEKPTGRAVWTGRQTLWMVSGYVPVWAKERFQPELLAAGCHRFRREDFTALWIASNELPLRDELIPFLITRTGKHLRDFLDWAAPRNPLTWVNDPIVSMNMIANEFLRGLYTDAQEEEARRNINSIVDAWLVDNPTKVQEITEKAVKEATKEATKRATQRATKRATKQGALLEARDAVKGNLRARKFVVRPEQLARIDACTNLDTLHRWRDGAVTAASVDEALAMD